MFPCRNCLLDKDWLRSDGQGYDDGMYVSACEKVIEGETCSNRGVEVCVDMVLYELG